MKKGLKIGLIVGGIILALILLILSSGKVSTSLGTSAKETMDSGITIGTSKLISCGCLGLAMGEKTKYCYGIRFNCLERCDIYFKTNNSELLSVFPCGGCSLKDTCMETIMEEFFP